MVSKEKALAELRKRYGSDVRIATTTESGIWFCYESELDDWYPGERSSDIHFAFYCDFFDKKQLEIAELEYKRDFLIEQMQKISQEMQKVVEELEKKTADYYGEACIWKDIT